VAFAKSDLGGLTWLVERCRGLSAPPAHAIPRSGLRAGKDAPKPSADLERGLNMKQQETPSPQVGEPRNEKPERKKRFLIVKLEERIAPKHCRGVCTTGCAGGGGTP
jgi:hypothetical protein